MNKRKVLSIIAFGLALIVVTFTTAPVFGSTCHTEYLYRDLMNNGSPLLILFIIFILAAFVLSIISFLIKKRAKLLITLSVVVSWLTGTAVAIEVLLSDILGIIPLISYFILCLPILICNLVLKDNALATTAQPVNTTTATVTSPSVGSVSMGKTYSQNTAKSESKKIKSVEDKPMTKKEAEGLLAYIWVRQYNTLPFEEALDKIMSYLIEQKYVITPEMEAELSKAVGAAEDVSGDMPAANNPDLRHAREARLAGSWDEAKKYYERVRDNYPDFVEAKFYYPYCKLLETKNGEFLSVFGTDFAKIMSPLAKSVPHSDMSVEEQKELALAMIVDLAYLIEIGKGVARALSDSTRLHMDYRTVTEAICDLGLAFEEVYAGDTELLKATALAAFKVALEKIDKVKAYKALIDKYVAGIQRYEPNFSYPKLHTLIMPSKADILSNITKKIGN